MGDHALKVMKGEDRTGSAVRVECGFNRGENIIKFLQDGTFVCLCLEVPVMMASGRFGGGGRERERKADGGGGGREVRGDVQRKKLEINRKKHRLLQRRVKKKEE